ncbi:MAG: tRNA (adenosine(37)-N6)-threonylcarbamoyltransferase complex dimerization subunit type 1 TsaB [candidate division WOR-3 bacterium]|nr:tRNA (adenosine(37)-N6)-threonylcarbamoyltransferase complex dimerization subunit type 1 TsaB [candidate division WOR-3 bacterium]MCX7947048.1 tRNA (adenosine(37)-N6)-threonylcarbamoyltransferase complex dimerization subunit type 1 TsaB [candidate division WOR-3 bacterium]MDW8149911.1 tRNA (adenosine(37)-N6)-threonylcarbamoyltransferase complex dimerization subunit type 1 TsaB [candidate division WOR-3 bacterium]
MILAIETSTEFLSIAIGENDNVMWEYNLFIEFSHTENLNKILSMLEVDFSKIEEVVISRGPGFFTSLRISTAFSKAFKIVYNDVKFKAVSSLKNIAYNIKGYRVIPILKAPKNKVYACAFDENFNIVLEEGIYSLEELKMDFPNFIILENYPTASNLIRLSKFENYVDIETFEPNYIREPDALYNKRG